CLNGSLHLRKPFLVRNAITYAQLIDQVRTHLGPTNLFAEAGRHASGCTLSFSPCPIRLNVVIRRFRLRLGDVAKASTHPVLHIQAREFANDPVDLARGKDVVLPANDIERDARGAQRDLGFLVHGDRWSRVERDAVPDQLRSTRVDAGLSCKSPPKVGAFHFTTSRPRTTLVN